MKYLLVIVLMVFIFCGCRKFLSVPAPNNQLISATVFSSDQSANAAVVGMYSDLMTNSFLNGSLTFLAGLAADEFTVSANFSSTDYLQFQNNGILPDNGQNTSVWSTIYPYVYDANSILDGINESTNLSTPYRNQLRGEALFMRAFCNFYLTQYYGEIPVVLSTDYQVNQSLIRSPVSTVYSQIIADLNESAQLLSTAYDYSNGEKIRATRWSALALLARVYLYAGNWGAAAASADTVIQSGVYSLEVDPNNIFLANSSEAILQFLPVNPYFDTHEGNVFIPADSSTIPNFLLRNGLLTAFEPGDLRRLDWIDSVSVGGSLYYYPFKYKIATGGSVSEYYMILRLAEQYLIRAEANARLSNTDAAVADLNILRSRALLPAISAPISADSSISLIAHERRIEFFAEWGHRWLDLKRTNSSNLILGALKPGNWSPYDTLWPVPLSQINADPNLTQNSGYK